MSHEAAILAHKVGLLHGALSERDRVIALLQDLIKDPSQINLEGAIIKIKQLSSLEVIDTANNCAYCRSVVTLAIKENEGKK